MRIFTDYLEDLTRRRGLYCVWVPASPDAPTPLVACWIDPQAEQHEERGTANAAEVETLRCPGSGSRRVAQAALKLDF